MEPREYSTIDRLIHEVDQALHTVFGPLATPGRPTPAADATEHDLDAAERDLSARLMRINHAGEVAAQALYQGQALTARLTLVREKMEQAAREENDHLSWTEDRIRELGGHASYLSPFWYAGSFALGALAGAAGDRWSLGFVAETENQVVDHLDSHLARLPRADEKSRAILEQMRADELRHATTAIEAGGTAFPGPLRSLMTAVSKIMTRTAYWL